MPSGSLLADLRSLTNDQVTKQVERLNQKQRRACADLLLYLSELDCRKLYRNHACSSLFDFLTARLGQSEDVAYRWMWGARLTRAFPLVYGLLADGKLHLSALMLLKPHLTAENHREWLTAAAGRSKRDVDKLVAARCPKADVPSRVRRLPETSSRQDRDSVLHESAGRPCSRVSQRSAVQLEAAVQPEAVIPIVSTGSSAQCPPVAPLVLSRIGQLPPAAVAPSPQQVARTPSLDIPSRSPKIQPLSAHSYRVVFTASNRLKEMLDRAGELVSHTTTPADLPALLERALDLLIEREECTYVDQEGRRCQSRHQLEFDHYLAHALGGPSTIGNLRLRCHSHNTLAAEQVFGEQRIALAIAVTRERRTAITAAKRQLGSSDAP